MRDMLNDYECLDELNKIIEDGLISSGKMLRSKLLITISQINAKSIDEKVIHQATAIEITHLASLLHDDIIDDSKLRRGEISTQAKYGKDIAVFAGDYMIARVFNYLYRHGLYEEALIISNTIKEMCNGEVGQNLGKYRIDIDEDSYFRNIEGKTASFFKSVCKLGCKNARLDKNISDKMEKFGLNLGLLFQIRDDYLDIFSNKELTGKEEFKDFREGIYTYPIILALEENHLRDKIRDYLIENQQRNLAYSDLSKLKDILLVYNIDKKCINKMKEIGKTSKAILDILPEDDIAVEYLFKIINKVESL